MTLEKPWDSTTMRGQHNSLCATIRYCVREHRVLHTLYHMRLNNIATPHRHVKVAKYVKIVSNVLLDKQFMSVSTRSHIWVTDSQERGVTRREFKPSRRVCNKVCVWHLSWCKKMNADVVVLLWHWIQMNSKVIRYVSSQRYFFYAMESIFLKRIWWDIMGIRLTLSLNFF